MPYFLSPLSWYFEKKKRSKSFKVNYANRSVNTDLFNQAQMALILAVEMELLT